MEYSSTYKSAINLISEAVRTDPKKISEKMTDAQFYSEKMAEEIRNLEQSIDEHIDIAARCQHLFRWEIPRSSYPMNKTGYYQWRKYLYEYQAEKTGILLKEAGYNNYLIEKCCSLIRKKDLGKSHETQLIEDTACIVFVKYYLNDFIPKHSKDKLIDILRKTTLKMSQKALDYLNTTDLPENVQTLLQEIPGN